MVDEWEKDSRHGIRRRAMLGPVISLDPAFETHRETIVDEIQRPEIKEEVGAVEVKEKDKISVLEANRKNVNIDVKLVGFEEIKNVGSDKYGKPLLLCIATVKDDSGSIPLTLWNRDLEKIIDGSITPGSILRIKNGYVREFQGKIRLTLGRKGELSIIRS